MKWLRELFITEVTPLDTEDRTTLLSARCLASPLQSEWWSWCTIILCPLLSAWELSLSLVVQSFYYSCYPQSSSQSKHFLSWASNFWFLLERPHLISLALPKRAWEMLRQVMGMNESSQHHRLRWLMEVPVELCGWTLSKGYKYVFSPQTPLTPLKYNPLTHYIH